MSLKKIIASLLGQEDQLPLVSIDIGSSKIKAMVIDLSGEKPKLLAAGMTPMPANSIKNNIITDPKKVGLAIRSLVDANEIQFDRVCVSVPGPTAFTKKVTTNYSPLKDLDTNIRYEAGSYIPHNVNDVFLDYQVVSTKGTTSMDVLLVAVKNEVVESYLEAIMQAGLETAIVDVDFFALENMFQLNYPETADQTVAVIDIGARFTSVNIIQDGRALFTGDVSVGGRLYNDALVADLGMEPAQAEEAKMRGVAEGFDTNLVVETLDRTTEHIASELHKQLGFFWNASNTDRTIEAIYLSGGSSNSPGLIDSLNSLTGIDCQLVEPFREIDWSEDFDKEYLEEIKHSMGISVGLAVRRNGDKEHAIP